MVDYKKFLLSNSRTKQKLLVHKGKKVVCDFCRREVYYIQIVKSHDRHHGQCIYCANIPEFKEFLQFKADIKKTLHL